VFLLLLFQIGGFFLLYFSTRQWKFKIINTSINNLIDKIMPSKCWFIVIQMISLILLALLVVSNSAYLFVYLGGLIASLSIVFSLLFGYHLGSQIIEEKRK
jgi:uncharacterized protein involved in cysteine biosynthesis